MQTKKIKKICILNSIFSFLGFGDIPLGKKLFWSAIFYMLLIINFYAAGALFLFLAVLYKKRGEEEFKTFMSIHGWTAIVLGVFALSVALMIIF